MRRLVFPVFVGVLGAAVLVALGVWQTQRLQWKQGILAEIEARIAGAPVPLPADPDPEADRYLPVTVSGALTGEALHVLVSVKRVGPGYRIVEAFESETGRRILLDRGFAASADKDAAFETGAARVRGNLHWPDEIDAFTPEADVEHNIWFARDVPRMAAQLGTEPVLVIAASATDARIAPLPVGTEGIPNDHLQYAVTWFGLAAVWVGMTGFWIARTRRAE